MKPTRLFGLVDQNVDARAVMLGMTAVATFASVELVVGMQGASFFFVVWRDGDP